MYLVSDILLILKKYLLICCFALLELPSVLLGMECLSQTLDTDVLDKSLGPVEVAALEDDGVTEDVAERFPDGSFEVHDDPLEPGESMGDFG